MQILLFSVLGAIALIYLLLCKVAPEKVKTLLRKKWWILPLLLGIALTPIIAVAQISSTLSNEEIIVRLEEKLMQQLQEFDDDYGCEGSTVQISSSDLSIEHPTIYLGNSNLVGAGDVEGYVHITVNTPAAYPYLEKPKGSYTLDDWNELKGLETHLLDFLNLEEGLYGRSDYRTIVSDAYYTDVSVSSVITFLDSEGNEYLIERYSDILHISKNEETVFEQERPPLPVHNNASGSSGGSSGGSSSGGSYPCSWCGGDGKTHDWGTEMHGSGHTCWKCGGDGRL